MCVCGGGGGGAGAILSVQHTRLSLLGPESFCKGVRPPHPPPPPPGDRGVGVGEIERETRRECLKTTVEDLKRKIHSSGIDLRSVSLPAEVGWLVL